jgi:2-aminoadipate transaminase
MSFTLDYADRMKEQSKSFIREILKVTQDSEVISFAGGLPNAEFFPVQALTQSAQRVLSQCGPTALQYSASEGYAPLRSYIADQYADAKVTPEHILITNGSQQAIDLIGRIFLNQADSIVLERPGYLGALMAFSMYEPVLHQIDLLEHGMDLDKLKTVLSDHLCKLIYTVVNFQNPSGLTYSEQTRRDLAKLMADTDIPIIEDDPYGRLRFEGKSLPSLRHSLPDQVISLGSFSKIVSPGLRLGWICAPTPIIDQLLIAKQASDLHTCTLTQRILHDYLENNSLKEHLHVIRTQYRKQRDCMLQAIEEFFPPGSECTRPQGGLFLWVTLPKHLSSLELFDCAIQQKVAFVPGTPFYRDGGGKSCMRLNFSNANEIQIKIGIERLAHAINHLQEQN